MARAQMSAVEEKQGVAVAKVQMSAVEEKQGVAVEEAQVDALDEKQEEAVPRESDGAVKPLLLLDVDGVLNAFPKGWTMDYRRHVIDGYTVHLHLEVRQMVAALAELYEIVWFTLWNHKAAPEIGPHVGLEHIGYLPTNFELGHEVLVGQGVPPGEVGRYMYAKTPLLPTLLDARQRWVWIDDAHSRRDRDYLVQQGFDHDNFRLIRTDENLGLTWDEVGEAVELALTWAAGGRFEADWRESAKGPQHTRISPDSVAGRSEAVGG